jgi:hypothetical protein
MLRKLALTAAFSVGGLAAACSNQNSPYMDVSGGGFIFNYRVAEAVAGLVITPRRALPEKSTIEVTMENPAGGDPIVMRQEPTGPGKVDFITDPLQGIKADKDYTVTVRLVSADGAELQRIEKKFHSQLDQSALPSAPLTVGPGYDKNPAYDPKNDTTSG